MDPQNQQAESQPLVQGTADKPEPTASPDAIFEQAKRDREASTASAGDQSGGHGGADRGGNEPDPLIGLPEPTRKLIQEIQLKTAQQDAELKTTNQKLAKAHGTIGNLTQRLNQSLTQLQKTAAVVEAEEKAKADKVAADKAEKRRLAREAVSELPGVLDYLDEIAPPPADDKPDAAKEAADKKAREDAARQQQSQQGGQQQESAEELTKRLTRQRELSDVHPGWIPLVNSAEFKQWQAAQPEDVKALGDSHDVKDAAKMISLFKKHKEGADTAASLEAQRDQRLNRGENVQGNRGGGSGSDANSHDAIWEKAKRDREKARASA